MARSLAFLALALSSTTSAFIGYGISMYKPSCAFACRDTFGNSMLECSDHSHVAAGHSHGSKGPTSADCWAGDTPFLTSVANCINATCEDVETWTLEKYWAEKLTKNDSVSPKWTYQETLTQLAEAGPPTRQLGEMEMLNFTAAFDHDKWEMTRLSLVHFEYSETMHSRSGLILLVTGFATPVFVTALGYLPFMTSLQHKLKPRLVWPSLIGTYHVRELPFSIGVAPTLGQTWYIAGFTALTVVMTAVGYKSSQPSSWFPNSRYEVLVYISNRTGVLAFALGPLLVLFAGRNNILLWFSNWSHSTYLLLHRWVARLFILLAFVHCIIEVILHKEKGNLSTEHKLPYWIWGTVAILSCAIILVVSAMPFRRFSYEIFLISHVILVVFIFVGAWYHIEFRYLGLWGYNRWLWAAFAVWVTDRAIRVLRVLKNGIRRSNVVHVTDDVVRIDIPGVRLDMQPGKHVYAFFPRLHPLRPWENHPFSIIPTAQLHSLDPSSSTPSTPTTSHEITLDIEKLPSTVSKPFALSTTTPRGATPQTTAGISLYVRKHTGLTKYLSSHASLLTLIDGPYHNKTSTVLSTDRLVLIAGGVGVTAVLPFATAHPNVTLHWCLRTSGQGLVDDLAGALVGVRDRYVSVGQRINIGKVLKGEEEAGWGCVGVVVCGPGSLCDEVRTVVAERARVGKVNWEMDVEAFSW